MDYMLPPWYIHLSINITSTNFSKLVCSFEKWYAPVVLWVSHDELPRLRNQIKERRMRRRRNQKNPWMTRLRSLTIKIRSLRKQMLTRWQEISCLWMVLIVHSFLVSRPLLCLCIGVQADKEEKPDKDEKPDKPADKPDKERTTFTWQMLALK